MAYKNEVTEGEDSNGNPQEITTKTFSEDHVEITTKTFNKNNHELLIGKVTEKTLPGGEKENITETFHDNGKTKNKTTESSFSGGRTILEETFDNKGNLVNKIWTKHPISSPKEITIEAYEDNKLKNITTETYDDNEKLKQKTIDTYDDEQNLLSSKEENFDRQGSQKPSVAQATKNEDIEEKLYKLQQSAAKHYKKKYKKYKKKDEKRKDETPEVVEADKKQMQEEQIYRFMEELQKRKLKKASKKNREQEREVLYTAKFLAELSYKEEKNRDRVPKNENGVPEDRNGLQENIRAIKREREHERDSKNNTLKGRRRRKRNKVTVQEGAIEVTDDTSENRLFPTQNTEENALNSETKNNPTVEKIANTMFDIARKEGWFPTQNTEENALNSVETIYNTRVNKKFESITTKYTTLTDEDFETAKRAARGKYITFYDSATVIKERLDQEKISVETKSWFRTVIEWICSCVASLGSCGIPENQASGNANNSPELNNESLKRIREKAKAKTLRTATNLNTQGLKQNMLLRPRGNSTRI